MKSLLIQFHAESNEIIGFIKSISRELGLTIALIVLRPFKLRPIENLEDVDEILSFGEKADLRIAMKNGELDLEAKSPNHFLDLNPDCIMLDIGCFTGATLNESSLSFRSDDMEAIRIANKVANKLKKLTKAGAIAVNPDTGAEAMIRTHRYTAGAKRKYDEGVKILPVAGKSLFKLPE